jgi:nucleotide-binding universal stress UspA family protein
MIRRLLVAMDGSAHGGAAATLAIAWARRFDAGLVAVGVLDEPSITRAEPVPLGAGAYKRERDEARLAHAHQRITQFLATFRDRCQTAGVACSLIEDIGTPHEQIVREAAACDVVVLGKQTDFHFETQDRPDATLAQVLRLSPRPVVVAPRHPADGEGILVAYGAGREVVRTLQTFTLLGLASDETVHVLAVEADAAAVNERLRRAGDYLTAHGVRHQLCPSVTDAAPATAILDEVRHRRPRLLVMGAQGHHPVRDLFFTSVTRAVLQEASVPVFVGA